MKKNKYIILAISFLLLSIFMLGPILKNGSVAFKECVITKSSDIASCTNKTKFVKVIANKIYDTGYAYEEDKKHVGRFIDIDLDNKSFISLVPQELASEYFDNSDGNKQSIIYGELTKFDTGIYQDALAKIKNSYVKKYSDYKEEDILALFLPYQLDAYNNSKKAIYTKILICGIGMLGFLGLSLFNFIKLFKKKSLIKKHA